MLVVPAVDLLDRCVVRVEQGDEKRLKVYSEDPVNTVRNFAKSGASIIHVVDLNAAIRGDPDTNREIIEKMLTELGSSISIQVAGGIRSLEVARRLVEFGAKRIVISSIAYSKPDTALEVLRLFGDNKVVLALDYDVQGRVRTSGWSKQEGESVDSAILRFSKLGFGIFLITAIERDGLLRGPDLETLQKIRALKPTSTGAVIIASGGVTSETDVASLARIGIDEAIVGKAIYEGRIPSIFRYPQGAAGV